MIPSIFQRVIIIYPYHIKQFPQFLVIQALWITKAGVFIIIILEILFLDTIKSPVYLFSQWRPWIQTLDNQESNFSMLAYYNQKTLEMPAPLQLISEQCQRASLFIIQLNSYCHLTAINDLYQCWQSSMIPVGQVQYIPRNMHTVFALLCFVVVLHWLIFPYPSGLLHWHCGNLTIAPAPAKQPWWIWINTSCEFIMNDCITTTKQSTTKPCAYFLGYTVILG